jgi:Flp pilus assembly protein TadD
LKKTICIVLLIFFTVSLAVTESEKEIFTKGVAQFKQGKIQESVDTFTQLVTLAPNDPNAYKNRGVSYMQLQKPDLAIADFEKVLELFPTYEGIYSNLGVAWYYKKEYQKAIKNYDKELSINTDNPICIF